MQEKRIRIVDIAERLGLSTATVSNVIHGKTSKMSPRTAQRVWQELEAVGYIPDMAGVWLAQKSSRIIGVVVDDSPKYEGKVLEDGFVTASLNALSREANEKGFFLMVKTTRTLDEVPAFASMWRMEGLILMGFCEADYAALRQAIRTPIVVYDGYMQGCPGVVNLVIDHADGGRQAGQYLKAAGHTRALCLADNNICMDKERMDDFAAAFGPDRVTRWQVPVQARPRQQFYEENFAALRTSGITAIFAVSDFYALECMRFLQAKGLRVPGDMAVVGFDDSEASRTGYPSLTTVRRAAGGHCRRQHRGHGPRPELRGKDRTAGHIAPEGEHRRRIMSKFIRELGKIAVPVTLQSMLQASFSIVDQIMIGQLGAVSIAAVGLGGNYSMIFNVVSGSVGTVAGILIAQFLGAGDKKEAWSSLTLSTVISLCLAGVFLGVSLGATAQILGLYTKDAAIIAEGCVYFKIIAFSFAPMGLSTVLSAWLRCRGHANIPFAASIGAVLSNVVLNYVLIFGKLGLPACGVRGAAIATLVSQLVNLALIATGFLHCLRQDGERVQPSLHFTKITRRDYLGMITPILVSQFLWSLGQNVESAVYGHLGTQNLAAYTLTCPIQSLIVGALSGLSAAAGVLIGKRLGRKEYDAAYGDAKKIMVTGLVGAAVVSSLLVGLAGQYVGLYRVEGEVRTLGHMLLVVFALYAPIKVENMILGGGILKSGGNTRMVMIIDIAGTWGIGIPLCFFAAYVLHWGIVGVYTLLTAEELFRLVVSLVVFRKRKWMVSLA